MFKDTNTEEQRLQFCKHNKVSTKSAIVLLLLDDHCKFCPSLSCAIGFAS